MQRTGCSAPDTEKEIRMQRTGYREGDSVPTTIESGSDLAGTLRRAAAAHGKPAGQADPDWPGCYVIYVVREQAGEELPA